jgi:hypothetical protein
MTGANVQLCCISKCCCHQLIYFTYHFDTTECNTFCNLAIVKFSPYHHLDLWFYSTWLVCSPDLISSDFHILGSLQKHVQVTYNRHWRETSCHLAKCTWHHSLLCWDKSPGSMLGQVTEYQWWLWWDLMCIICLPLCCVYVEVGVKLSASQCLLLIFSNSFAYVCMYVCVCVYKKLCAFSSLLCVRS